MSIFGHACGADTAGLSRLQKMRRRATIWLLIYFTVAAAVVTATAAMMGLAAGALTVWFVLIGAVALYRTCRAPADLSTRLIMAVAINTTWMFGLYVVSHINDGDHMLEMHMLYFVNGAVVIAYACWRSVVMTSLAALLHHLVLTVIQPLFVWPNEQYAWTHMANHSALALLYSTAAILIALSIARLLEDLEAMADRAEARATHDEMTGLLNRRGLREELDRLKAAGNPDFHMLQIDLDGLKQINDTAGHARGDLLIIESARVFRRAAPTRALMSRTGGDEFVVVIPKASQQEIDRFLETVFSWSRTPCSLEGQIVRFGASIGIASSRQSGDNLEDVLVDADVALYEAKNSGRNRAVYSDDTLRRRSLDDKALADEVLRGLDAGEFVPYFQTQHDPRTGALVGLEALARWRHPDRGVLAPGAFLSAVQATGRGAEFDCKILRAAVETVCRLEARGRIVPKLAVNVSLARLREPMLLSEIRSLPPMRARLAFEVVETVFIDKLSDHDRWTVDALRDTGVEIEIDDFGTGHASIVALTHLAPDAIKIDRELVAPITEDEGRKEIVRSIIRMATAVGVRTIAEGVETEAQARLLEQLGVDVLQGFHCSKTVAERGLDEILQTAAA